VVFTGVTALTDTAAMPPSVVPLAVTVQAAGSTDIGRARQHNEDAVLLRDDLRLYIVADGAGGHNAGNVASALATTSVANFFENTQKEMDALPEYDDFGYSTAERRMARAIQRANRDIIEIAKSSMRHRGMGTTVVAVWVRPELGSIHIGHVGDSRCYRYRAGQFEQLTHDHSLHNDVLETQPDLPDAAMARLPRNVVTRALGMEQMVRAAVQSNVLVPGDRYLLCSDGLTDALSELEMTQAIESQPNPAEVVRALIGRANEADAQDNLAALVLFCDVGGAERAAIRMQTVPFPPPRINAPRPSPQRPSRTTLTEGSSPEIVIVGMEYESDDPSGLIHVVPQESATEGFLSAIDSFVGPMRARAASKPSSQLCVSCGTPLTREEVVCPQCNAPQPLG
jgi:serine/threonine protein phosphatase PrpC